MRARGGRCHARPTRAAHLERNAAWRNDTNRMRAFKLLEGPPGAVIGLHLEPVKLLTMSRVRDSCVVGVGVGEVEEEEHEGSGYVHVAARKKTAVLLDNEKVPLPNRRAGFSARRRGPGREGSPAEQPRA